MLSPAVASISAEFPELPYASITLILTIVNVTSLPILLLVGSVAGNRIGFRPLCLFGTLIFSIGGTIPFFIQSSYATIIASRVLVAIGAGCVISLPATLAFRLYSGDKAQLVQGWSNAASSIMGALMMLVVGLLATISTKLIWLSHLIGITSFLLVTFALPEPSRKGGFDQKIRECDAGEPVQKVSAPMPKAAWGLLVATVLAMVAMYPILLNSSLIIVDNAWGDADASGASNALSSIGCFFAGLLFGRIYAVAPRLTPLLSGIAGAVGSIAVFAAPTYPVMLVGSFLIGWAYMQLFCYIMGAAGIIVPPSKTAFIMSCILAATNLAVFVAPHVATFIQTVVGSTSYQLPFVVYAVIWIVLGAALFAWYPESRVSAKRDEE